MMGAQLASEIERSARRRFRYMSLGVLLVYALLVATHRGEFWPFSIFPMFSRGGRAFTRITVRDLGERTPSLERGPIPLAELPGRALALAPLHVDQNDLSKLLLSGGELEERHRALLEQLFRERNQRRWLIVYAVHGEPRGAGAVAFSCTPLAILGSAGARLVGAQREPH